MRLLFWVVAIACLSCVAEAQQPNSDARLSANGQLAPQRSRNPPPGEGSGPQGTRLAPTLLRPHKLGSQIYHGQLAWGHGRWHHERRNGRYGWWWDVGGVWYFYSEPVEGPPAYVSDTEVADETTAATPPPQKEPQHAFYYRPGDLKGVPYDTIAECLDARQQAESVGVCVIK